MSNHPPEPEAHVGPGFLSEFPRPTYEDWKKEAEASLKGAPLEKKTYTATYENITLKPMYLPEDAENLPHMGSLPGFPPYVRGAEAGGYVVRPWIISQEIALGRPEDFNREALKDLSRGQTGLRIRLDRPTRLGLGPEAGAAGEVGQGLSVVTADDLTRALADIDLARTPLFVEAGPAVGPLLSLLAASLQVKGLSPFIIKGVVAADPLGELAASGRLSCSIESLYIQLSAASRWAGEKAPGLAVVLASGCPYHDAGASAVQELGLALAAGAEYIRALIDRGLTIDQAAPRVAMQMSIGCHFFMEIAKLRASRLLWTTLIEAFGGSEESQKLKLFARTSAFTKAALDPWVNLLRNTTEAFAGAMGLVDGLFVTPFDDPVRPADDFSRRVSRNLQIILQEECHFTHPIDPAGGAWYVETLTDQVARDAWGVFQEVEKDGGLARALSAGRPQALLAQIAEKRKKNLAVRKDVMVGVNLYAHLGEKPLASPDADWEGLRSERIEAARAAGEKAGTARSSLESLAGQAAEGLMAATIQAAKAGARLEDLASALGQGNPVEASALVIERASRPFEDLRANAQAILEKTGRRPLVFLATMGPASQHKPRADFSTGFFEVGGFEVVAGEGYPDVDSAAKATLASGARIVVICSTDATYPDIVPAFCQAVKAVRPDLYVVLAGKPAAEFDAAYKEAGLDDFIFIQTNCLEKLGLFQKISQEGAAS